MCGFDTFINGNLITTLANLSLSLAWTSLMAQEVKNLPGMRGALALIPGSERPPGEGNGNLLQYSCLENPHGQGSLVGYSPWGRKESDTTERLTLSQPELKDLPGLFLRVGQPRLQPRLRVPQGDLTSGV